MKPPSDGMQYPRVWEVSEKYFALSQRFGEGIHALAIGESFHYHIKTKRFTKDERAKRAGTLGV